MKQFVKYSFLLLLLLTYKVHSYAQDVSISGFVVSQYNTSVLVSWTIEGGSTCNGIKIYRSSDSLVYQEIGSIEGICGSSAESTDYFFTDTEPVANKTNYYRLKLGNSQMSEIRSIFFSYVQPNDMIIRPNPANESIILELNKDQNSIFSLRIIDVDGRVVMSNDNVFGKSISIDISQLDSGNYVIELIDEVNKKIRRKLVII